MTRYADDEMRLVADNIEAIVTRLLDTERKVDQLAGKLAQVVDALVSADGALSARLTMLEGSTATQVLLEEEYTEPHQVASGTQINERVRNLGYRSSRFFRRRP